MDALSKHWGKLNVLIHSIAFAPKDDLAGRVTDVSLPGFLMSMEVSVWSLLRLTHLAETASCERGRECVHDELFRRRKGCAALRDHGPGEIGSCNGGAVHGCGTRTKG